jgi:hypothetical protein
VKTQKQSISHVTSTPPLRSNRKRSTNHQSERRQAGQEKHKYRNFIMTTTDPPTASKQQQQPQKAPEVVDATENTDVSISNEQQQQHPHPDHIQIRLELGRDVSSSDQDIAQEVMDIISTRLHSQLELGNGIALLIRIDQCSKGSAWSRMCCGELGCGWVVLETKWSLWQDHTPLIPTQTETMYDSGALGCADLNDSHHADKALRHKLAPHMADKIMAVIRDKLPHNTNVHYKKT